MLLNVSSHLTIVTTTLIVKGQPEYLFSSLKSKIVLYVMEMDGKEKHYWELGNFLYGPNNSGTNKLEFLNTFFQTKCILIELSKVKKKKMYVSAICLE